MLGKQHKEFAIPFSIFFATSLIGILGFGLEYLLVIPIGYYFSVWCDIDQSQYAPKETRRAKALWQTLLWLIPLISACVLIYFGYNYINKIHIPEDNYKYIGYAAGTFISSILLNVFLKSKFGTFFTKHRGFTHTLIVPILLILLYNQLGKMDIKPQYEIVVKAGSIVIAGLFAGLMSHIFIDGTCRAGVPLFWPLPIIGIKKEGKHLVPVNVHWGNAVTSDPKRPGKAHRSSIIATKFWSFIFIGLTALVMFIYRANFISLLPF